jgi:16S rRNA (guanine966-N2)-methyltransferase
MRIVAGKWGGRRLQAPAGRSTRPTADRVREALFSALGERIVGQPFVDLFAGTGAVGLEAASRGATPVLLVESDRRAAAVCQTNIDTLGAGNEVRLRTARAGRGKYFAAEVVFADPPYDLAVDRVLEVLFGVPIALGGVRILECRASTVLPQLPCGVAVSFDRVYGGSRLVMFSAEVV